jgi:type IV pilus assembly protein PilM
MAFLTRSPRGVLGLDLDPSFMAAVEVTGRAITRAVSHELPAGLIVDGEVSDPAGLSEALRDFFKAHGLPRAVRLGISNRQIVVRQIELPRIDDPREQAAAVRFQSAEAIAMPLDEAVLDFQPVGETVSPEGIARTRYVVVAARAAMVERLVEAVRGAGLRPLGIDLDAFALVRALIPPAAAGDDAARVYCHLGGVTNLAVAVGSSCLFTRALATVDLRADRAGGAEGVEEPGEGVAATRPEPADGGASSGDRPTAGPQAPPAPYYSPAGSPTSSEAGEAPSSTRSAAGGGAAVATLAEEIRLSVDFYMTQPEARRVSEVVLSGTGAELPGVVDGLRAALGLPVSVADPLAGLDASGLPPGEDPHRHTVAAGLALGAQA